MSQNEQMLPMSERMRIAVDLKKARKRCGLGQIALAAVSGVSRNTIQRMEFSEHVSLRLRQRVFVALENYLRAQGSGSYE